MIVVTSGSASAQDISAAYVAVVTLAAPTSGGADYVVEIRLTGLNAGHNLVLKQDQGGSLIYYTAPYITGQTATIIRLRRSIPALANNPAVSIQDVAGLSTSVSWSYTVYRVDDLTLEQPQYLVPKGSTTVPLLFLIGQTSPMTAPTVSLLKNTSGAFVTATGTVTILSSGWCALIPSALDTGTEGPLLLRAVSGSNTQYAVYQVFSDTTSEDIAGETVNELQEDFNAVLNAIAGGNVPGGNVPYTIEVNDSGGSPVANAEVWVTTDSAGDHVVEGTQLSKDDGTATFLLTAGDYFAWAERGGKNHINGEPFTVN